MRVVSYRGHSINDGTNYTAGLEIANARGLADVDVQLVELDSRWPAAAGVQRPGREFYVTIILLGTLATQQAQLAGWFDPDDETPGQFVVEDDGGGGDRYVMALCRSLREVDGSGGGTFVATMVVDGDVRWRLTSETTDTWSITASGQTRAINNAGDTDAYPTFEITPTSAKTGSNPYRRFMPVVWRAGSATRYPVDIANASLNTTAASTNFYSATGADIRVLVNGSSVDFWLSGINTTTTKIFVNLDFQQAASATLGAAIASTGTVDTIDASTSINAFPSSGLLLIDSEVFTYTGKNNSLKRFTGVTRAARGTSMAAHTTTDTIYWLQHDIWVTYGSSSLTAWSSPDTYKPMFSLATTTNASWDFDDFVDYTNPNRPGTWVNVDSNGIGYFTADHASAWVPLEDYGSSGWGRGYIYNPCGITNANYQNGAIAGTVTAARLESSSNGSTWTAEYTIPIAATWSRNEALATGATYAAIYASGASTVPVYGNYVDADDLTLTLNSSNTPLATVGAEQGNYTLETTLTNTTTGDALTISYTTELSSTLIINTDARTVTDDGDGSSQFQAVSRSGSPRVHWLPLQAGSNTLRWDDTGTNGVTVVTKFRRRYYN